MSDLILKEKPNPDHLTKEALAARIGVSTKTVENMLERGELPAPIRYSRKNIKWELADVVAWEKKKKAAVAEIS